jgi:hypothetical protein
LVTEVVRNKFAFPPQTPEAQTGKKDRKGVGASLPLSRVAPFPYACAFFCKESHAKKRLDRSYSESSSDSAPNFSHISSIFTKL